MPEPFANDPSNPTLSDARLPTPSAPGLTLRTVTLATPEDFVTRDATTRQPSVDAPPVLPASGPGRLGRYETYEEIGRGGMGAVFRGRDTVLGRHLALKVLLPGRQANADTRRRFHEEAQIGGQLQHPGLVPVYELGEDSIGRPFFTMKLVEGRTLTDLLEERPGLADDLPRFLQIFEQACQAVGYAHARGVIHRDLKPANIMVGAFGEVQVMDWGLAKVLGSPSTPTAGTPAGNDRVQTERSVSGDSDSRAGSVMGTPAYMPPEQARGEIDQLDARADVFGLGAILCEILTGLPPFLGKDVTEVLSKAARGDLADTFARLNGCGAAADLVKLACDCLAAAPGDRPTDGSAVAERVAGYRAHVQEQLRTAELARARAEARAVAERRRRRMQLALAGVVLLLFTLAAGGGWWVRQQRLAREMDQERRQAFLVHQTDIDLDHLAVARQEKKWDEAWKALERAEDRLASNAPPEWLRERVRQERQELEPLYRDHRMLARLEEARQRRAAGGKDGYDYEGSNRLYRDAFAEYGLDLWNGSPEEAAQRLAARAIRDPLLAALDDWASNLSAHGDASESRLRDIAGLADDNEWRRELRAAFRSRDWEAVRCLAGDVRVSDLPPSGLVFLADILQPAGLHARALEVLQAGQRRYPTDFWLNFRLAKAYQAEDPPQTAEVVRYYSAALALAPDSPAVRNNLALVLTSQKRLRRGRGSIPRRPPHPARLCPGPRQPRQPAPRPEKRRRGRGRVSRGPPHQSRLPHGSQESGPFPAGAPAPGRGRGRLAAGRAE